MTVKETLFQKLETKKELLESLLGRLGLEPNLPNFKPKLLKKKYVPSEKESLFLYKLDLQKFAYHLLSQITGLPLSQEKKEYTILHGLAQARVPFYKELVKTLLPVLRYKLMQDFSPDAKVLLSFADEVFLSTTEIPAPNKERKIILLDYTFPYTVTQINLIYLKKDTYVFTKDKTFLKETLPLQIPDTERDLVKRNLLELNYQEAKNLSLPSQHFLLTFHATNPRSITFVK